VPLIKGQKSLSRMYVIEFVRRGKVYEGIRGADGRIKGRGSGVHVAE
jgi:hypothetical protein